MPATLFRHENIDVVRFNCFMSLIMRKPDFCICKDKDADQLRGYREADQRLCFRYIDSTIPLLPNYKPLTIFCDCTDRFVSDLVRNPEDRFSHNEALIIMATSQESLFSAYHISNFNERPTVKSPHTCGCDVTGLGLGFITTPLNCLFQMITLV